jgi:hypothetical protein
MGRQSNGADRRTRLMPFTSNADLFSDISR